MAGQGTTAEAFITLIGGERSDTRNGKERYVVRTNDGRELSIWDRNIFDAVMAHLHEGLKATIFTKQDDRGNWWSTLQGLPDMGIKAAPAQRGDGGAPAGAPAADLGPLMGYLDRIATALENLVSFQVESVMQDTPEQPQGPGPDWPNDEPPE